MTSMTGRPDLAAALCEVCCHARTVKYSRGGGYVPRGYDYTDGTCDLKCDACGRITRHALVLPEDEARPPSVPPRDPGADPYVALIALGWRIVPVVDLDHEALIVGDTQILLVNPRIDREGQERAVAAALEAITETDPYRPAKDLGIKVIEVQNLGIDFVYLYDYRLALVSPDLSAEQKLKALARMLARQAS